MDTSALYEVLKAFAPSISGKLIEVLKGHKLRQNDVNIVLVSLLAEQNNSIVKCMEGINQQLMVLNKGMNSMMKQLQTINEGITVLLKRTEE